MVSALRKFIPILVSVLAVGFLSSCAEEADNGAANEGDEPAPIQSVAEQTDSLPADGSASEPEVEPGALNKPDNSGNYRPPEDSGSATTPVQEVPDDVANLPPLECSVTAQINPDQSIAILFYVPGPSNFTYQEKNDDSWTTVLENKYYSGSGGLPAGTVPADEDGKTVRLIKLQNGTYVAYCSEVLISRTEVEAAGGIKTFTPNPA